MKADKIRLTGLRLCTALSALSSYAPKLLRLKINKSSPVTDLIGRLPTR